MPAPSETMLNALAPFLGTHTAHDAVCTFSQRTLGPEPESLGRRDALRLVETLRPTLAALVGAAEPNTIVADLSRKLKGLS